MELHGGDIVEVVATKRRGKIDNICGSIANDQEIPARRRVQFEDGKEPLIQTFKIESELGLVECPLTGGAPNFCLTSSIM
jgi:hypothetical protein